MNRIFLLLLLSFFLSSCASPPIGTSESLRPDDIEGFRDYIKEFEQELREAKAAGKESFWKDGHEWYARRSPPANFIHWLTVTRQKINEHVPGATKLSGYAYLAQVTPTMAVCTIKAEDTFKNTPLWLRRHEFVHCMGFFHKIRRYL